MSQTIPLEVPLDEIEGVAPGKPKVGDEVVMLE
jgi:hypothetical protein